jgi:hypothetical protein
MTGLTAGLQAALLLARGRADGLLLVPNERSVAARSFWAMAVCLPIIVAMRLMSMIPDSPGVPLPHLLARDFVVFAVSWLLYTLLSHRIAGALDRGDRWPRFIAAWNWCNVIENFLLVVGSLPGFLGAPPVIDQAAQLVALGWAVWVEWYVTRSALGVSILVAAWMVLLDESIGVIASGVAQALGGG